MSATANGRLRHFVHVRDHITEVCEHTSTTLQNRSWKFHQIYNCGAVGDKAKVNQLYI